MKFFSMLPNQKLILARVETRRPPTIPVVAKSAPPSQPFWLTFILWACAALGRPLLHVSYTLRCIRVSSPWPIRAKMVVLTVLAAVLINTILEHLAAGYIEKMVGVA